MAVIEYLGGACRQCGYSADPRALVFDHVNGDGAAQRRSKSGNGYAFHKAIMADNSGKYQLLCTNCNSIKRIAENERGSRVYKRATYKGSLTTKWCPRCKATKQTAEFCCNAARADGLSVYCARCRVEDKSERYKVLRLRVIAHLGGCCKRCGYAADDRALAIDHVAGDGGTERKSGKTGTAVFNAALQPRNLGRYQVLCANCNTIKRFEQGERGARVYERTIPTELIGRPDRRSSPEIKAMRSEQIRRMWQDPELRTRLSKARSESMKRRWASGEIPNKPKLTT